MNVTQVRKMRCDDQADGCTPCRQNQTECKTTDRITGKATVRGYVESLERRVQELEAYNHQLQGQVISLGGNLPSDAAPRGLVPTLISSGWTEIRAMPAPKGVNLDNGTSSGDDDFEAATCAAPVASRSFGSSITNDIGTGLPQFRSGLTGNNYLGVSTGDSLLSSIRGTSMNVLGIEIDIADYTSPDLDEPDPSRGQPVYNKSYRAFIQTAFGASPKLSKVELPPRKQGMEQAEIFFKGIHPFLPILHRPTFMKTVSAICSDAILVWCGS